MDDDGLLADVPVAIEEAARVDGYSKFKTFLFISTRASPGLAATGVLCMMFAWNDYVFASALTSAYTQIIPIAASLLVTQTGIAWGRRWLPEPSSCSRCSFAVCSCENIWLRGFSMGAVK